MDLLARSGRLERALLIVTSDHGEHLGEHGHLRHVFSLHDDVVRIPLIAVLPDGSRAGEVVREPVSIIDVFSSILAQAGAEPPPRAIGRDVLSGSFAAEPVFAEYYYPNQAFEAFGPDPMREHADALAPFARRLRAVEQGGLRLLWGSDGRHELYEIAKDPEEGVDLTGEPRFGDRERALHETLVHFVETGGGDRPLPDAPGDAFGELDEETAARLRELGYLR